MVGLLDIAPLTKTSDVRGHSVTVSGVGAQVVGNLLFRFPELRKAWAAGKFDTELLLTLSDDILAALIAGCVAELDEANAANLAFDEKAELIADIVEVSFRKGPAHFMETLTRVLGAVGGGASPTASATTSRKQSSN